MSDPAPSFSQTAASRKTEKVLATDSPVSFDPAAAARHDDAVRRALADAGTAPFHYDRKADGLAEPWRATLLTHVACRRVGGLLPAWLGEGNAGKLPAMFAACGAAVVVSWLPQFRDGDRPPTPKEVDVDDEHLAAAAAMVQTLLLSLTARGFGTYWSSGGKLRDPAALSRLGFAAPARLLAVVFVDYPESLAADVERIPGKLRDRRSDGWLREPGSDGFA